MRTATKGQPPRAASRIDGPPHPSASHIFLVLHAGLQALIIHLVLAMIKHLSLMAAIHLGLLGKEMGKLPTCSYGA